MGEKTALDLDEIIIDFSNWQEVSMNESGPCMLSVYVILAITHVLFTCMIAILHKRM